MVRVRMIIVDDGARQAAIARCHMQARRRTTRQEMPPPHHDRQHDVFPRLSRDLLRIGKTFHRCAPIWRTRHASMRARHADALYFYRPILWRDMRTSFAPRR